jgi:crotonobetaine/carnitine-CoA ligase
MYNHPETLIAMYAASVLGAVMVPIDPRSKGEKLLYQIKDSGSKKVIFEAEFLDSVSGALKNLPEVQVIGCLPNLVVGTSVSPGYPNLKEILEGPEAPMLNPRASAISDLFQIMYTSGTTGNPKGIHVFYDRILLAPVQVDGVWHYPTDSFPPDSP